MRPEIGEVGRAVIRLVGEGCVLFVLIVIIVGFLLALVTGNDDDWKKLL